VDNRLDREEVALLLLRLFQKAVIIDSTAFLMLPHSPQSRKFFSEAILLFAIHYRLSQLIGRLPNIPSFLFPQISVFQKGKMFPKRKNVSKKENCFQKGKMFPKRKHISEKETCFQREKCFQKGKTFPRRKRQKTPVHHTFPLLVPQTFVDTTEQNVSP
jgi:hypothetical protein